MPRLALIENLTSGPIPPGSTLMVEFDPASQWYNASVTLAAGWLRTGGRVIYSALAQPPDDIRSQFRRLGLRPEVLEKEEKLTIEDWYTTTLGQKSKEKHSIQSLKVSDLSLSLAQTELRGTSYWGSSNVGPDLLFISDDDGTVARFNDEKTWVELRLTRVNPGIRSLNAINFFSIMRGVQSEWAYKRLEGASDGIIDFRLEEPGEKVGGEAKSMMRIRFMKSLAFDRRWHQLKTDGNLEVSLDE